MGNGNMERKLLMTSCNNEASNISGEVENAEGNTKDISGEVGSMEGKTGAISDEAAAEHEGESVGGEWVSLLTKPLGLYGWSELETVLLAAFEELAARFRDRDEKASGKRGNAGRKGEAAGAAVVGVGAAASGDSEA